MTNKEKLIWWKRQYNTLSVMPDTPKEVLESWEKGIEELEKLVNKD